MFVGRGEGKAGDVEFKGDAIHLNPTDVHTAVAIGAAAVSVAAPALGILGLLLLLPALLGGKQPREDWPMKPEKKARLSPINGICRVMSGVNIFYGICLNDKIRYAFNGKNHEVQLDQIRCLECLSPEYDTHEFGRVFKTAIVRPATFRLSLADGSVFEGVVLTEHILFATATGEVKFSPPKHPNKEYSIYGLDQEELGKLPKLIESGDLERKPGPRITYPDPRPDGFIPDAEAFVFAGVASGALLLVIGLAILAIELIK